MWKRVSHSFSNFKLPYKSDNKKKKKNKSSIFVLSDPWTTTVSRPWGLGTKVHKEVCDISLRKHTRITTLAKLQFLNRTSYCGLDSLLTRIDLLFGDHLCVEHGSCWSSQKHDPITYSPKEQIQAHKRYNSWQET